MNKNSRKLLFTTIAIVVLTLLSGFILNLLTNREDVNQWLKDNKIETSYLFGGVIFIGLAWIFFTYLQVKYAEKSEKETEILTGNIEPDVKRLFDSLKERYQKRYDGKLDGRFEIPLEVSEDWQSDKPITYKFDAEARISDAVEAVRKAFREKGRLLIVGSPGSGKTVLLLKLALELLGDEYEANQKLPVIFNLASWSDDYKTFEDWLIDVLNTGNGLSKDFAKTVLRENRIIFLLDGLDELARNEDTETAHQIRARCLESLNDYLREGRQTVICCPREEFAEMQKTTNTDAPVAAKVEILDLTKPDIDLALHNAKKHNESRVSAEHLEKIIETNEAFLEVLSTPFYFTTALEVFDQQMMKEKDFPTNVEEFKKYLLDKFVESKISHTRDLIDFEKDKLRIKKWLKWLSRMVEKKQLVAFELAELQPEDFSKPKIYRLIYSLIAAIPICILFGIIFREKWTFLLSYIVFQALFFVKSNMLLKEISTQDMIYWDLSSLIILRTWKIILIFSLIACCVMTSTLIFVNNLRDSLSMGIIFGLFCIFYGLIISCKRIVKFAKLENPYKRLQSAIIFIMIEYILWFGLIGFSIFIYQSYYSPSFQIEGILWVLLPLSLIVGIFNTPLWQHFLLRICLYFEDSMPLKYSTFLDYAAEARILEKDGGQWRFRHQNLQEYFAGLDEDLTTK